MARSSKKRIEGKKPTSRKSQIKFEKRIKNDGHHKYNENNSIKQPKQIYNKSDKPFTKTENHSKKQKNKDKTH